MAFGVTPDGFVTKDLGTIRGEIETALRATIDPLLDTSDQTPMGQLVAVMSGQYADLWEVGAAAYAARYPDSASDSSLDEVSSITGTIRDFATKTLVTGEVTLEPNKALPAGSVAHLSGRPSDRFITLAEVPANPGGGTFSVDFEAESAGSIEVLATQLNTIAEPVSGWLVVTNAAGATKQGTDADTDSELREKRAVELTLGGSTNVDAIRADLVVLAGVEDAQVTEDLDAHTVSAVLRGGVAAEIGQALFDSKAGGIRTVGSQLEVIIDSQGIPHDLRWDFAAQLDVHVSMTVETDPLVFDGVQGEIDIKAAIAAYVNALDVGDDVIYDQIKCAALSVAGVERIPAALIGFGAPTVAADLVVSGTQFAASDVANIAVVVT